MKRYRVDIHWTSRRYVGISAFLNLLVLLLTCYVMQHHGTIAIANPYAVQMHSNVNDGSVMILMLI